MLKVPEREDEKGRREGTISLLPWPHSRYSFAALFLLLNRRTEIGLDFFCEDHDVWIFNQQ
jgi:hypothetical protein